MVHRQTDLAEQFSSMLAHHMDSDNLLLLPRQDEFDKPGGSMLRLRTVNICPWKRNNTHLPMLPHSFCGSETDAGCLWISKGTPGDYTVVGFFLPDWKQGIVNSNSSLVR